MIDHSIDYFETEHYIFTHGWILCLTDDDGVLVYNKDWRKASGKEFYDFRWYVDHINGMQVLEKKAKQ